MQAFFQSRDLVSDAVRGALSKRTNRLARILLWLVCCAVFFLFAMNARYAKMDEYASYNLDRVLIFTASVFTAIFAVSLAIQFRIGRNLQSGLLILFAAVTGIVLLAKISLLDYVSDDYTIFLSDWIGSYTDKTIKEGLGWYIQSDYTPPYLYLLLIISRIKDCPWQYLVKAWSILADILLGYTIMRLSSLKVKGTAAQLMFFHMAQILPTVVFNGAYWGQCDVIYSSFCLLGIWKLFQKRSARGLLCFGVALSFKLQTVFFLPALLPLWLRKDVKLRHLILIPGGYMMMMIPALWGGKSLHHVLHVYFSQAGSYNFMTINGPTLYQLFPKTLTSGQMYKMFGSMAMLLAMGTFVVLCLYACVNRKYMDEEASMLWIVLSLAMVPFLLPKMHERYLFGADVASLVLAAYCPRRIWIPMLMGFASYVSYTAGLPGDKILEMKWAALFELGGILLTAYELVRVVNAGRKAAMIPMEVKA